MIDERVVDWQVVDDLMVDVRVVDWQVVDGVVVVSVVGRRAGGRLAGD